MIIRDAQQLFALLEDGQLNVDLMHDINDAMQATRDAAGNKGKAKAIITLKIELTTSGVSTEINADYAVKKPKIKRAPTLFFATDQGLSDQHPKQMDLGFRDIKKTAAGE